MILCDIGNTSFHFFDEYTQKDFKIFDSNELPQLDGEIYFISVNENKTAQFLTKFPNALNLANFYSFATEYTGMGIDRIVACINFQDGVIVDAGSAITVDVMENRKHLGGFILPGINAQINSYATISPKLKVDFEKNVFLDKIPTCTKDAINYGILKSIILPIQQISQNKQVYFTGGDGKVLSQIFTGSIFDEFIVFNGMRKIIKGIKC